MKNFGKVIDNFDAVTKQYVDNKVPTDEHIKGIKVDNATLADTAKKVQNAFTYKAHNKAAGTVVPITYDGSKAASLDFSADDFAYDYSSGKDLGLKLVDKGYATKTYVDNQDALKLDKSGGSITGNLTVGGNLTINGTTTTVDSTTLQVKDKLIEVAHGNTTTLTTPAGLVAPKYDGTNSGALVFDSTGTAYVGDVKFDSTGNIDVPKSGLQPLATRTGLVGGNLVQYDSSAQTLKDSGKKISDFATSVKVNGNTIAPSGGVVDIGTVLTDASKFATAAQGSNADSALTKANANATEISNIKNGTTKVKSAEHADTADSATSAGTATKATEAMNVTENIKGHAIADIFESDGTTVKKATSAGTADKVANGLTIANATFDGSKPLTIGTSGEHIEIMGGSAASPNRVSIGLKYGNLMPSSYNKVTVDGYGFVIDGENVNYLTSHQSIKSINTNNTAAQTVNASEAIVGSGTINLHKVAKTGSYNDLLYKPTIPAAANNGTLTIQKNGTDIATFGANQSTNTTANIIVPTKASDVNALPISGGTITGNLTVGGNLTINGTTTTVDSTTLQVKDKLIEVAHGNTATLTTPAGLVAPKYDGTSSGALVFDSTGTAYVGDVTLKDGNIDVANSGLQPLATRTGLVGGNLVQYDSSALTLKDSGKKISDFATSVKVNGNTIAPSGGVVDIGTVLTDASKFATSAQGTKADNAMPKSGGTFTGEVKFGSTENFQGYYIKRMIGSLGAGTAYNNLDSSYKDGTWHRMWRLRFPSGSSFWGKIKITLYGGYSSFNASGVMSKSITCNFNTSNIYNNVGCYDGLGVNVEQDFRISEAIWNATVNAWEVLIWQKNLSGNNSPAIMLECWTRNDTNYINAFNSITAQPVELTQSTSYSAQKASPTGGTKTVTWATLPVYENPLGEEIATMSDLPNSVKSVIDYNKADDRIKIGYAGASLFVDDIKYIAGYTTGDSESVARIKDIPKDKLKSWLEYATVAESGSYNDLVDKPTIPTFSLSGTTLTITM